MADSKIRVCRDDDMKLNEICEVYSGYALKAFNDAEDGFPVIKIGNIFMDGTLNLEECQYTTDGVNEKYYSQRGDIYIALSGATTGKIGIMDASEKYVINQRVGIVRQKSDDIPQEYIKYFLLRQTDRILQEAAGCAQPNISPRQIAEYVVPDTSQEKMQEICEVLDRIKKIIDSRKVQISALDNLIKARFVEMFGDPVYNTNDLPIRNLNELGSWASGGTPSRTVPEYFKGNIDWYSAGELNTLFLEGSVEKITEEAIEKSATKLFKAGSLLIGMYDTAAFKMGILKEDSASNQACACITPNDEVNIIWLYYELQMMKEHFLSQRRGVRQKNLNLGMIKAFKIPITKREQQDEFSDFVKQVDKSKVTKQIDSHIS